MNEKGEPVRNLTGPARPGLNRATWDLQADEKHRFGNARLAGPVFVDPGTYNVNISVDEEKASATVEVGPYPGWTAAEDKAELPPVEPGGIE